MLVCPSPLRAIALLQLLLVLPPMLIGSVCIPVDGTGRLELGLCECPLASAAGADAAIAASDAGDCAGCRDEAVSALRSARPEVPFAPAPVAQLALLCAPDLSAVLAAPSDPRALRPPASRRPILRC